MDQNYLIVKKEDKLEALKRIIDSADDFYGLIFCATKITTDELARRLVESGYAAEAIHGDLSQEARERTLRRFRSRLTTILVATDVAARGLDIERLTHVVNWDLPNDRETYVHRIGRTGRAGRRGKAVSLALPSERFRISQLSRNMERILGSPIQWMKVPQVKSVMKAIRRRIVASIIAVLPPLEEPVLDADGAVNLDSSVSPTMPEIAPEAILPETTPFLAQVRRELIEKLGAERTVEALITRAYGEILDPSRYGQVMEFQETPPHEEGRGRAGGKAGVHTSFRRGLERERPAPYRKNSGGHFHGADRSAMHHGADFAAAGSGTRVYVGLGREQGASARDVAELLGRAGNVPGRFIDSIEMKEHCAFATLPEDAAQRAYTFSRKSRKNPVIRPASPERR